MPAASGCWQQALFSPWPSRLPPLEEVHVLWQGMVENQRPVLHLSYRRILHRWWWRRRMMRRRSGIQLRMRNCLWLSWKRWDLMPASYWSWLSLVWASCPARPLAPPLRLTPNCCCYCYCSWDTPVPSCPSPLSCLPSSDLRCRSPAYERCRWTRSQQ